MNITIIGLGLMGGSLAIDLRRTQFATSIIGVDSNESHKQTALELGLVDRCLSLEQAVVESELIIIAIPVNAAQSVLSEVLDLMSEKQVVTDFGSTKLAICQGIDTHSKRHQFVAGHPIAGTENVGPKAAIARLFEGKTAIICDRENSSKSAFDLVQKMYITIGMQLRFMSAADHDKHLAYVSHLSHLSSFALALTVLDIEKSETNIFDLAGSGFSSTARLAKSSPDMWTPIFFQNKNHIIQALDEYMKQLSRFKESIQNSNKNELNDMMKNANEIRRILKGDFKPFH